MTLIEIATPQGSAFYRLRVSLEGSDYLLDFAWNERAEAWALSVSSADDVPIVSGIRLVSNRPLLRRFRATDGLPPGDLIALDLTKQIACANFTQLGADVPLYYVESTGV